MDREEFNTNSRVEELEEKNAQLVMELEHVHSLYDNLLYNQGSLSLDQRHILQLKAKNAQLERQVEQLNAVCDIRAETMSEMENFALEMREMIEENQSKVDINFIKRWSDVIINKIRQYQTQTKLVERLYPSAREEYLIPSSSVPSQKLSHRILPPSRNRGTDSSMVDAPKKTRASYRSIK